MQGVRIYEIVHCALMLVAARDTGCCTCKKVSFVCKATCNCLREILDNDKNGQGRMNGEGEQWTSIEG